MIVKNNLALQDLNIKSSYKNLYNTKNNDIMSDMIIKNERKKYASDLTDRQWEIIKSSLLKAGNKSKWEKEN